MSSDTVQLDGVEATPGPQIAPEKQHPKSDQSVMLPAVDLLTSEADAIKLVARNEAGDLTVKNEESHEARIERLGRERPEQFKTLWAEIGFVVSIVMSQVMTVSI